MKTRSSADALKLKAMLEALKRGVPVDPGQFGEADVRRWLGEQSATPPNQVFKRKPGAPTDWNRSDPPRGVPLAPPRQGKHDPTKRWPTDPQKFMGVPTIGQPVETTQGALMDFLGKAMKNPGGALAVIGGLGVCLAPVGIILTGLVGLAGVVSAFALGTSLGAVGTAVVYGVGGSLVGWGGAEAVKAIGSALGNGHGGLEKTADKLVKDGRRMMSETPALLSSF